MSKNHATFTASASDDCWLLKNTTPKSSQSYTCSSIVLTAFWFHRLLLKLHLISFIYNWQIMTRVDRLCCFPRFNWLTHETQNASIFSNQFWSITIWRKAKNCAKKSLGKRVLTSIVLKARGVQLHLRLLPTLKIHSDSLSFMLF